ncbi:MAG: AraC family transcriptional regulator [Morganella sp. (in: enterobacteria)]
MNGLNPFLLLHSIFHSEMPMNLYTLPDIDTISIQPVIIDSSDFNIIEQKEKGLYILISGSMKWQDCTSTFTLNKNEVIFSNQGSYAYQHISGQVCLLWIPLSSNFLRDFLQRFSDTLSHLQRITEPTSGIIFFSHSDMMEDSIAGLYHAHQHNTPAALMKLKLEELLLIIALSEQGIRLMSVLRQLSNRQAERLQIFMEKHYLNDWKLNEFSKEFGMGLTTFKELFGSVYGTSPRAWISERRLLFSHQLLLNTQMSIVDISMEAGFSSQSYFTQSYRKRFGFTPSKTRSSQVI